MLGVGVVFVFFASIAFLGFIVNSLFEKIKITNVLPLIFLGLLFGPIFHVINVQPNSEIGKLTQYIDAIAVAFILFDAGANTRYKELRRVFAKANTFTFLVQASTGILAAIIANYMLHIGIIYSLIFGFAISGPSSIIVPTVAKVIKVPRKLKATLIYESIITDVGQLVIPLILIEFATSSNGINSYYVESFIINNVAASPLFGFFGALFWLYVLKEIGNTSREYGWMLTITMVIATYGMSVELGLNAAIAIFVFGLVFYNLGIVGAKSKPLKSFYVGESITYIVKYQKESSFFISTFFFFYLGLAFSIQEANYYLIILSTIISLILIPIRLIFSTAISEFLSKNKEKRSIERKIVTFNVARGLSPAIIAVSLISYGINLPGIEDAIFLIILITNILASIGLALSYNAEAYYKEK
ncbi:MAG: cation:proton antiporter [Candidatus Micrarchaeaceae archaeon]